MSETPLLALPLIEAAQAQKHITHNEALLLLDAAIHLAVITRGLAAPPATPADGDRYLVAASATGAWAGQSGKLAFREAGAWRFAPPRNGWRLWAIDEQKFLLFDGTAWRDLADIDVLQNVSLLGVNTTADAGNRLSVSSPATLLNHEGAGHQLKINKQTATDTAALLFQTNFSGRAEMGLAGDDNFHFKVSPDGAAWNEAIHINKASGLVTLTGNSVSNAALADMATATLKGRATAGSGDPEDLTGAQATALLDTFTNAAKGLVPASGGGTANFLRADGTFAAPPSSGISDGDKGDITVSVSGTVWTVDKLGNQSLLAGGDLLAGLHNPNFELGDFGWTKGTGWTIENDGANAYAGNWVAKNTDTSGTQKSLTNDARPLINSGENVYAEARLKTSAGVTIAAARLAVVWYDKDGAILGSSDGTNYTSAQLSYVLSSVTAAAPAGAVYYSVRFDVIKTAGTVWVDAFHSFRKRSASQLLNDGPVINVLDYGAKGDAATDDTAAIAAALAAGLNVYFPPRRYVIAGNLASLRSGHVLFGPGGYTSGTTNGDVGGAKFLVTTTSGAVFSAATPSSALNGVNFSNITMNVTGTPSWVIDLPTVTSLHLSRLGIWVVDGVTATGCIRTQKINPSDNSWTASLYEVNCRVPDAATVYSLDTDVSDTEIVGGSYTGGLGARLRGTGNIKTVASRFDRASASGAGLTIAKATESRTAHTIIGNQFDNNFAKGILIDGDFNDGLTDTNVAVAITGNQFRTVGAGTFDIYFKNLTGPVLDGGTITGNTHASVSATKYSFDPARWTGIKIFPLQANDVTNTELADMATARIKGRATAGTGDPEDLTGTQATALLDTFTGALKGLVPASGGGTTNFLRADGTFAVPPGDGDKGDIVVSGSGTVWTVDSDIVTDTKLRNSAALSVIGRSANSTGDPADIAAAADFDVLRRSGTVLGFGKLDSQSLLAGRDLLSAVQNYDFELGDLGWTKGTGWTIEQDAANARYGNWVAKNTDTSGTAKALDSAKLGCVPGDVVYAEGYVKTSAGMAMTALAAQILWYDKDQVFLTSNTGTNYTTDQLSYVLSSVTGTAPANALYFIARVISTKTAGTVWVDSYYAVKKRNAAQTLLNATVANTQLADMATARLKGRVTTGTGSAEDLTGTQATTLLDTFSSALKGLVPSSGGGTTNFLRADGTFAVPPGTYVHPNHSGDVTSVGDGAQTIVANAVTTTKIIDAAVTNVKLANMAAASIKGRATAGTGSPEDLTGTQATTLLDTFTGALKGLVPASGGGTTNFLRADGTFATPSGGGDVVGPASATDNAITRFDLATGKLVQNSSVLVADDGSMQLPEVAAPTAAAADTAGFFALDVGARTMLAFKASSGLATPVQPLLARNKVALWTPPGNATTVPGVLGFAAPTALGTATARNVATTNLLNRLRRLGYVSSAVAGNLAGHYVTAAQNTIGDGTSLGGFHYVIRFGVSDAAAVAGARMFVGLRNAVAAPTNVEPNTLTNAVGVAQLSTGANLQIVYGGSAAQTAIDLGANFPANSLSADAYELSLFAPVNSQVIYYRVERLNTGNVATGTLSGTVGTAVPAATTFLGHAAWRCNNATALAVGIDVVSLYIESDN